jgi:hypothetical protein
MHRFLRLPPARAFARASAAVSVLLLREFMEGLPSEALRDRNPAALRVPKRDPIAPSRSPLARIESRRNVSPTESAQHHGLRISA